MWFHFQDPPPLKSIEHASDAAWIAIGEYAKTSWAMKKTPGCLGYLGDEILPSYVATIINHYKDPY